MIEELLRGYREFRAGPYRELHSRYERLAHAGQKPKAVIISCCDSRVDPATILHAGPGDLFVVRNVANIVPPYAPDSQHHGTSAAIEFAITALEVPHAIVMGHGRCGGIQALREGHDTGTAAGHFIPQWISIGSDVRDRVVESHGSESPADLQLRLEHAMILHSIANLRGFPFVAERIADGRLSLHGWHFDVAHGRLAGFDAARDAFVEFPEA